MFFTQGVWRFDDEIFPMPYELTEFQYFKATVQQVQSVFFIGMQCLGPRAWDCPGRDHKVAECQK